ncbi:DUF885 family protein [Nevskia sp.]|uniref:DUF885 domain-containing protein n=1 Tax=Nevskia sp. TaxID=1929292 RepID=UPI0025F53D68|nr:DUF885 family protein [Nevskia sp.]
MTLRSRAVAILAMALLTGCASTTTPVGSTAAAPVATLAPMFAEYWEEALALRPLQATFIGDARYNDQLPNTLSAEYRAKEAAFDARWLARVKAIDATGVSPADALSLDILRRNLERSIEAARFPDHLMPVNQFYNLAAQLAQLGTGTGAQPFKTVADYAHWAKRAAQIPVLFDQAIANMREGVAKGVVQPDVLMIKTLSQLDALAVAKPEDSLFWKPVTAFPDSFSDADRSRLTAEYRQLIAGTVLPAYARLRDYIRADYLPQSRKTVGLDALPDGAAWYASKVRAITTTALTPAEIHEIGLKEVARIHTAMRGVMQEVGYKGDLTAFFKFVSEDPRFTFASEAAALDAYNALSAVVDQNSARLFAVRPKAGFEIRPVEAFRAQSAAGGSYQRPSEDGTRPGIFYLNTYDLPSRKTWAAESLFLHEAIPGHHFQIGIQQELLGVPAFRRFGSFTAYIEGWGLYAESLGKELGVYRDPYQYFGRLQAELFRAIRLVVDTGLHAKGWSRQQVIDYMLANSAQGLTQSVSETERYMAIPGQALAYKIGELKIIELRRRAEAALGNRFDIKAFHSEVLKDGSLPLDVLEAKIDRWIAPKP